MKITKSGSCSPRSFAWITTKRRIAASRGMRIEKTTPALFRGLVAFPGMLDCTMSLPLPGSDEGSERLPCRSVA